MAETAVPLPRSPAHVQCPGTTTKNRRCRQLCKVAQYHPGDWMDLASVRYWQLGGCADHLDENDAAVLFLLEQLADVRQRGGRVAEGYQVMKADLRMAKVVISGLEADLRARRDAGEPACWQWLGEPSPHLPLAPKNLPEMEVWQAGRCACCGEVTPLVVDHDHWSGFVRGFLCRDDNRSDGGPQRQAEGRMAGYRQKHPAGWFGLRIVYGSGMWKTAGALG